MHYRYSFMKNLAQFCIINPSSPTWLLFSLVNALSFQSAVGCCWAVADFWPPPSKRTRADDPIAKQRQHNLSWHVKVPVVSLIRHILYSGSR